MRLTTPATLSPDIKWQYGLAGGIASVPFVAASYWETGSEVALGPMLLISLLFGYTAHRRSGISQGIGGKVGIVGSVPLPWMIFEIALRVPKIPNPQWFTALSYIILIIYTIITFVFSFLFGELSARIGAKVSANR